MKKSINRVCRIKMSSVYFQKILENSFYLGRMKKILLLLFLLPILTHAQKVALLNTDFKSPIIYTDSVTVQQTISGLFPVGINDFDTLYANLNYIKDMLSIRQRSKMKSFELHAGKTIIKISRVPFSNGDRYMIKATSKIGEIMSNYTLVDIEHSNTGSGTITDADGNEREVEVHWIDYGQMEAEDEEGNTYDLEAD